MRRLAIALTLAALASAPTAQFCYPPPAEYQAFAQSTKETAAGALGVDPVSLCATKMGAFTQDGVLHAISYGSADFNPDCWLPPSEAYDATIAAATAGDVYLGYYVCIHDGLFNVLATVEFDAIHSCCLEAYDVGQNEGTLIGLGSTLPGAVVTFELGNPQSPVAEGALIVSLGANCWPVGFGTLGVDPAGIVIVHPTGPVSAGAVGETLPGNPALAGTRLFIQGLMLDPFSVEPARLTNGLMLTFV